MLRPHVEYNSTELYNFWHNRDYNYRCLCHSHNFLEIYISVSGGRGIIINDSIYDMRPRDLFIIQKNEIHKTLPFEEGLYERFVLEFKPEFLVPFCTEQTNLLSYFQKKPEGVSQRISLTVPEYAELMSHLRRYESLPPDTHGFDVLKTAYFVEAIVYVTKLIRQSGSTRTYNSELFESVVSPILRFIDQNLDQDLSLDKIARHINLSKFYMCKIFQKSAGITINRFITAKRIARAKELLAEGKNASEVFSLVGFNDYSHFVRTFSQVAGMTTTQYVKKARLMDEEGVIPFSGRIPI